MTDDDATTRASGDPVGPPSARGGGRSARRTEPARQGTLREHNLRLVLQHVLEASIPPSRADIAAATRLTRGTVSALVDQLVQSGLVAELVPVAARRAGRPAVPLVAARRTLAAIGAEVNLDYMGYRVLDLAGDVLAERIERGDFRGSDPAQVLRRLGDMLAEVTLRLDREGIPIVGCCLALPGLVDRVSGPLRLAPNLGWKNVDVLGLLGAHPAMVGKPLMLGNDANLAARAESRTQGASESFLLIVGEVGIGGAIVLGGEVFAGRHGWSGEIGHTTVDMSGPPCPCGASGCLEQYAGKDSLMRFAGLDLGLPIEALRDAAEAGDPAALASLDRGAKALGVAIASFVNLVDVEQVVLGGTYALLGEHLIARMRDHVRTRVISAPWQQIEVRVSASGEHATLSGAALAVLHQLTADPTAWVSGAVDGQSTTGPATGPAPVDDRGRVASVTG
jgi:predicted NBD/HSP70 family sugar kinase